MFVNAIIDQISGKVIEYVVGNYYYFFSMQITSKQF